MADLEKLARDHAFWTDEWKRLKKEGEAEYPWCDNIAASASPAGVSCIEAVFREVGIELRNAQAEGGSFPDPSFDDVAEEMGLCEHCQRTRELKAQRLKASRHIGAIRAAITRAGRELQKEPQQ